MHVTAAGSAGDGAGSQRTAWAQGIVVLLSMAAVAALASIRIGATGFWLDEVYSVATALEWNRMWDRLLTSEANMWLYYLLLHFWLMLGHSEAMVRGLSVLAGVATVPLVYALARRLAGRRAGIAAVLLLAANVFFVRYAQEARAYSLVVLLTTASMYLFLRVMEDPAPRYWIGFALCAAGGIYAHFFAALVLIAQAFSLAFLPPRCIPWRRLVLSGCCLGILMLPIVLFQPLSSGQVDWLSRPSLGEIWILLNRLAGSRPLLALYLGFGALAIIPAYRARQQDPGTTRAAWRQMLVLLWLVIPPATTFVFSVLVKPVWVNRYLIICVPPLVLLGASGLSRLPRRGLRLAAVTIMLLLSARCLRWLYQEVPQEDWRSLTQFVLSNGSAGEPVLFYAYHMRHPFEYYCDRLEADPNRFPLCELAPEPYRPGGGTRLPDPDLPLLREIAADHDRVWLVLGYCWNQALGRDVQRKAVENTLQESHRAAGEHRFGYVVVRRYERIGEKPVGPPSPARENSCQEASPGATAGE